MLADLNVVMYNVVNPKEPFAPAYYSTPMAKMFKGEVDGKGTWITEAAAGWTVEHISTGLYRVHHYQSNVNYSMSVTVGPVFAKVKIIRMGVNDFDAQVVDVYDTPIDGAFAFAISFNDGSVKPVVQNTSTPPVAIKGIEVQTLPASISAIPAKPVLQDIPIKVVSLPDQLA